MELNNWNFLRGGVSEKIPSVGKVWIFSGITQYLFIVRFVLLLRPFKGYRN